MFGNNKQKISSLFQKAKSGDEFEVMFGNYNKTNLISLQQYLNMMNYINGRSAKHKLKTNISYVLDINYAYDTAHNAIYRLSIKDIEYLNQLMPLISNRKNHIIFSILANRINKNEEYLELIRKEKNPNNKLDFDDYDIRFRLSSETLLDQKEIANLKLSNLSEYERFNIVFRFKQRTSLILFDDKNGKLQLDVSIIKMSNNINNINNDDILETYEIELDYIPKDKVSSSVLDTILNEVEFVKKSLEQSNYLVEKSIANKVVESYKGLVFQDYPDKNRIKSLYQMQPITAEIQNMADTIPSKYSVTDKADGERYQLFIIDSKVYLLSTNLEVKYTGIEVDKKYNKTILDGEYIYVPEKNKYLYLTFDILYDCGTDVRNTISLQERINFFTNIVQNCFKSKFKPTPYKKEFDIKKLMEHYEDDLKKYVLDLNDSLNSKEFIVIKSKYYITLLGGNDCEVFSYSKAIWDVLHNNTFKLNLPYVLDGLMYTPLDQKYTRNIKDIKQFTFKWKPPQLNTIDFYITFEKDRETNKILDLYDDSYETNEDEESKNKEGEGVTESDIRVKGKVFRICNLQVGRVIDNTERPVPFKKNDEMNKCKIYLTDGQIKDSEGNTVMDNTVVEFAYDDGMDVPEDNRWVPIRTRYDKTDAVRKYNIKYGNNEEVAEKIWRSIRNKVSMDDIMVLADPQRYEDYIKTLRNRIDRAVIGLERKQNAYYQLITKLGVPQRAFHNWIKSTLIYSYCGKKIVANQDTKLSILDIGVGRGGDIMKFYHAKVKYMVGIDIDPNGLYYGTDGALSRYTKFNKEYPNFPKMYFIQADAGTKLVPEEQEKAIGRMTDENRDMIRRFFGENRKKFDVINCQFAIHYLLKDDNTFNTLCDNINMYLEKDGYMLISTFDADLVMEKLKENGKDIVYYTTVEGEKKVFHEIIQKFDRKETNMKKTGLAIDMFNPEFMNEGEYYTEYLVQKDFLAEQLYKKCGMVLIDSDTFENQYKIDKEFFTSVYMYESDEKAKKEFAKIAPFYDLKQDMNAAAYEITRLNRYYVFQKLN
jgi:SAM-dependent methyltransferase